MFYPHDLLQVGSPQALIVVKPPRHPVPLIASIVLSYRASFQGILDSGLSLGVSDRVNSAEGGGKLAFVHIYRAEWRCVESTGVKSSGSLRKYE